MLTLGFELEFSTLNSPLNTQGARYVGLPLAENPSWKFRTDSSCGPVAGAVGYEINSPVIESKAAFEQQMIFAEAWMRVVDAKVTHRAGFHVHVGGWNHCQDSLHAVISFFTRYERAFFALVSAERRENNYCARLAPHTRSKVSIARNRDLRTLVSTWDGDRRTWLNATSMTKHGTLELRLPEGTTDIERIKGWTNLFLVCCEGIVTAYRKNPKKSVRNPHHSSAKSDALVVHEMLTAAGTYGKLAKDKIGWGDAQAARKFVARRFREIHGYSYRTAVDAAGRGRLTEPEPCDAFEFQHHDFV